MNMTLVLPMKTPWSSLQPTAVKNHRMVKAEMALASRKSIADPGEKQKRGECGDADLEGPEKICLMVCFVQRFRA